MINLLKSIANMPSLIPFCKPSDDEPIEPTHESKRLHIEVQYGDNPRLAYDQFLTGYELASTNAGKIWFLSDVYRKMVTELGNRLLKQVNGK